LNKSPEELGIKNYTLFISRTGDTQQNYDNTADFQKNDFLLMNCLNCAVPDCTPAGTTILFGTKFYRTGVWDNVQPQNYQKMKDQMAEDFINEYEEATGIQIRDAIEEIETVSPATFARYMNTPDGEVLGYYGQAWDQSLQRMMSLQQEAEPVPGLLFCGGHGAMMDGYSSAFATGAMAAQQAIVEINEEEEHA
jgi:prolycopene isomerase